MNRKFVEFGWWVRIITTNPNCLYYFGAFENASEAELAKGGYVEDLELEGAKLIEIEVEKCQPGEITVCEEELTLIAR